MFFRDAAHGSFERQNVRLEEPRNSGTSTAQVPAVIALLRDRPGAR